MKLTDPWVSRGDVARIHCLQRTQTTRVKTRGKREWLGGGGREGVNNTGEKANKRGMY